MRHFIAAIIFIFIFSSCRNNSKNNLTVYRAADEGLQQSIKAILSSTMVNYHELYNKLDDAETMIPASKWQPVAMEIKRLSDSMVLYLQGLRSELISETGIKGNEDERNKEEWQSNLSVTDHVFSSHGRGKELYEKLVKYKSDIFAINPRLKEPFEHNLIFFSNEFDTVKAGTAKFTKTFFSNIPAIAASVMLSKLENNVRIIENYMSRFCLGQVPSMGWNLDKPFPLVIQNRTYLKAGEELEINAGIGNYTNIYKLKAPLKAGDYFIPVKIEFYKPDGKIEIIKKTLSYTVAQ